jgi:hypothetical protein
LEIPKGDDNHENVSCRIDRACLPGQRTLIRASSRCRSLRPNDLQHLRRNDLRPNNLHRNDLRPGDLQCNDLQRLRHGDLQWLRQVRWLRQVLRMQQVLPQLRLLSQARLPRLLRPENRQPS